MDAQIRNNLQELQHLENLRAREERIPTFSFTEAVRNLDLELRQQQEAEMFYQAPRITFPVMTNETANEFEIVQDYMDEHLEDMMQMQIQETLEQFCGLASETLKPEQLYGLANGNFETEEQFYQLANQILDTQESQNEIYGQSFENAILLDEKEDVNLLEVDTISRFCNETISNQSIQTYSFCDSSPQSQNESGLYANLKQWEEKTTPMLKATSPVIAFDLEKDDDFVGKRRLCRHFLKGRCNRGNTCDFLHDQSIFCSDEQKVFLGGLPPYITDKILQQALRTQGWNVINKPKVLQGFSPQICLGSVEEAQDMIRRGKIVIKGTWVDVRPFEAFVKDRLKMGTEDEIKRSIFLGGLSNSTTGWSIKERLTQLGFKTVNHPVVKSGFAPQVIMESVEQAHKLIRLKKMKIDKRFVEVRPYCRYRL